MNGFLSTYDISRARMMQVIDGLTKEQLTWRPHGKALSIFEMFIHLAGADLFFILRFQEREGSEYEKKLEKCARDKVINNNSFPFSDDDASLESLTKALDDTFAILRPMMENFDQWADKRIETPLGSVDGAAGIFARVAQHPAYHTGQAWIYRNDPRFPQ